MKTMDILKQIEKDNEIAIENLLAQNNGSCVLINLIYEAKECLKMTSKNFPNMDVVIEFNNLDFKLLSDVSFQFDVNPRYRDHKYISVLSFEIGKIILRSK